MNYNIFGSKSSIDYDIMMFVESIPDLQTCKINCIELEKEFHLKDKKPNINLAVAENGIILDVYKGTVDECNNSIFHTYEFHPQTYPKLVTRLIERDVNLKIARALRIMLSFLSRTDFRVQVKIALKSNTQIKIETLKLIKFNSIKDFNKNNDLIDVKKQIAFQIAQTLLLMKNIEVYSKEECCLHFPELAYILNRQETANILILDHYKEILLDAIVNNYDLEKIKE